MAEHLYSSQHDDKGNIFKNWEQIIIFSFKSKEEKWEYPGTSNDVYTVNFLKVQQLIIDNPAAKWLIIEFSVQIIELTFLGK